MTENVLAYLLKTKGQAYVMNLLGLNKQQQNPKYAISLGGKSFNPMSSLKRAGVNKMFSSGSSMGGLGTTALIGGAALGLGYLTNPLRKGSYNYNPNLQGQIDYASGRGYIEKNPSSGLGQYSDKSVLSGQNVVSGFGTNDYAKQLQNYIDKYGDKDGKGQTELEELTTDEFDKVDAFMEKQTTNNNNGGGGGGSNIGGANEGNPGANKSAQGYSQHFARGGIASL